MGKKPEKDSKVADQIKFEIPELAKQLDITDKEFLDDETQVKRFSQILDNLPPGVIEGIHSRMATELANKKASYTHFISTHNISKAETKLLTSLMTGKTVIQHAEITGISVNTARTHMRRLLDKTDSKGQLDLVQKVHSL